MKHDYNKPGQKSLRRALRRQQTPAERALWQRLRRRQLRGRKFKRQYGIGPYVVDFYCAEEKLAVELDGAVHDDLLRRAYDEERTHFLEAQGVRVVRFENRLVWERLDVVPEAIAWHFDGAWTRHRSLRTTVCSLAPVVPSVRQPHCTTRSQRRGDAA